MPSIDVLAKLKSVTDLPTLPTVITRLREAIADPDSGADRVARIMSDDPAISARVLRIVNSALYGIARPVDNLQAAVGFLGMKEITNIAITTAILDVFRFKGQTSFNIPEFWKHCICTGIANVVIYDHCRKSLSRKYTKDVLHLAGVIHDVGKVLYEMYFHREFIDVIRMSAETMTPLREVEKGVLGVDHGEVGAWLLGKWKFADNLVDVVRYHHDPENAPEDHRELVSITHASDYLCNLENFGYGGEIEEGEIGDIANMIDGLEVDAIPEITSQIYEESVHSEVLLSLLKE